MPRAGESLGEWEIDADSHTLTWEMLEGCDVGWHKSNIDGPPPHKEIHWEGEKHRVDGSGFDKTLTLEKMQELADLTKAWLEHPANIIVKSGKGKWYLKWQEDTSDASIRWLSENQLKKPRQKNRLDSCVLYVKR